MLVFKHKWAKTTASQSDKYLFICLFIYFILFYLFYFFFFFWGGASYIGGKYFLHTIISFFIDLVLTVSMLTYIVLNFLSYDGLQELLDT